jgi:hypothetical protein
VAAAQWDAKASCGHQQQPIIAQLYSLFLIQVKKSEKPLIDFLYSNFLQQEGEKFFILVCVLRHPVSQLISVITVIRYVACLFDSPETSGLSQKGN